MSALQVRGEIAVQFREYELTLALMFWKIAAVEIQ